MFEARPPRDPASRFALPAGTGPEAGRTRLLPRSLAARTALVLLLGLVVVQAVGLAIHALDRIEFARLTNQHEMGNQVAAIYRTVVENDPLARDAELGRLRLPTGFHVQIAATPAFGALHPVPFALQGGFRHAMSIGPMPSRLRPNRVVVANNYDFARPPGPNGTGSADHQDDVAPPLWRPLRPGETRPRLVEPPPGGGEPGGSGFGLVPDTGPGPEPGTVSNTGPNTGLGTGPSTRPDRMPRSPFDRFGREYAVAMQLPDDLRWLTVRFTMPLADPFLSPTLPLAFLMMTTAAGLLTMWAVRRLTAPLRTLASAAERLGRDVNSDPLPEDGPTEVAIAAVAFNTMASRIRRFVTDRTLMLTAIGHDLRTPITRLKLRAEFIDDEELQAKFLADLDELEAMVSATLAFGRDSADREPMVPMDLNALLSTILDDATDGRPDLADAVGFTAPPPAVTIQARSLALKRAFANLVGNAISYGGGVRVTLCPPRDGHVVVLVEDNGPGIPDESLDRVFEPFVRLETSRNRETGGTGLGLSIARNIIRAQGGDIVLANRAPRGLKATVTLVA